MTTRLSTAPRDAKPLSWRAAIAFPGSFAIYGHPPGNDIAAGDVRRCGPSPSIRIGSFKQG